jgi:hypothetical protein
MDHTESMRKGIAELEKSTSLRQISMKSGINYLTLRKIKNGETKKASSGVTSRFEAFRKTFKPDTTSTASRPGPKPKATAAAAPAAPAKKKPGRPKKTAAPAAAAPAAPAAAPAKKKPGRPKKAAAAPVKPAAPKKGVVKKAATKKKAGKPGPKPKAKAAEPKPAMPVTDFTSPMLGDALKREIEIAEARIEYLRSLQMVEEEFLKAMGKR